MTTTYSISHLEISRTKQQGRRHAALKSLLPLSKEEHDQCFKAAEALDDFKVNAELFSMVLWNNEDFRDLQNQHLTAYITKNFNALPPRKMPLDLNRLMINCLSSVRMYLDHVETYTKQRYGADSAAVRRFKKDCKHAYDSSFSYRLLYRLRNFAQHLGFPLSAMTFNSKLSDDDPGSSEANFVVGINRDELLSKRFDGWSSVKQEIEAQPPIIDINPHMDELIEQLQIIHTNFLADEFVGLREDATLLKGFLDRIPDMPNDLCLATTSRPDSQRFNFQMKPIPLDVVSDVFDEKFAALFNS